MITCTRPRLIFKHMVELPHCECVFCSTQEEETHRARIYLIFKEKRKVYARNGIRGNWEEVTDAGDHDHIWEAFEQAVIERKVPSFVALGADLAVA